MAGDMSQRLDPGVQVAVEAFEKVLKLERKLDAAIATVRAATRVLDLDQFRVYVTETEKLREMYEGLK